MTHNTQTDVQLVDHLYGFAPVEVLDAVANAANDIWADLFDAIEKKLHSYPELAPHEAAIKKVSDSDDVLLCCLLLC